MQYSSGENLDAFTIALKNLMYWNWNGTSDTGMKKGTILMAYAESGGQPACLFRGPPRLPKDWRPCVQNRFLPLYTLVVAATAFPRRHLHFIEAKGYELRGPDDNESEFGMVASGRADISSPFMTTKPENFARLPFLGPVREDRLAVAYRSDLLDKELEPLDFGTVLPRHILWPLMALRISLLIRHAFPGFELMWLLFGVFMATYKGWLARFFNVPQPPAQFITDIDSFMASSGVVTAVASGKDYIDYILNPLAFTFVFQTHPERYPIFREIGKYNPAKLATAEEAAQLLSSNVTGKTHVYVTSEFSRSFLSQKLCSWRMVVLEGFPHIVSGIYTRKEMSHWRWSEQSRTMLEAEKGRLFRSIRRLCPAVARRSALAFDQIRGMFLLLSLGLGCGLLLALSECLAAHIRRYLYFAHYFLPS